MVQSVPSVLKGSLPDGIGCSYLVYSVLKGIKCSGCYSSNVL